MPEEFDDTGIDIQSVQFRPGDGDLIIEITYAERRHATTVGIAKFDVLMFEARKAPQMVSEVMESLQDLVDEMLTQLQNPPMKVYGRQPSVSG